MSKDTLKNNFLYKCKMDTLIILFNSLVNKRTSKMFQLIQRQIHRVGTYIDSQECWNEFA